MIIDSSALIAILRDEPEAVAFAMAIEKAESVRMASVNFVEAAVVIDMSHDPVASRRFDELVKVAGIVVEPITHDHATIAREAYRDFGKGSGHRAGLNFGDCFAYALAKSCNEPILFKGDDFKHTDLALIEP